MVLYLVLLKAIQNLRLDKNALKNAQHKVINPRSFNFSPFFNMHGIVYKTAICNFSGRINYAIRPATVAKK